MQWSVYFPINALLDATYITHIQTTTCFGTQSCCNKGVRTNLLICVLFIVMSLIKTWNVKNTQNTYNIFFFLSFNLLIGWQLSIWNCCKPFFSLLYNCQLLCFWLLALSIVVEEFPRPFFRILLLQGCLLQTRYA